MVLGLAIPSLGTYKFLLGQGSKLLFLLVVQL